MKNCKDSYYPLKEKTWLLQYNLHKQTLFSLWLQWLLWQPLSPHGQDQCRWGMLKSTFLGLGWQHTSCHKHILTNDMTREPHHSEIMRGRHWPQDSKGNAWNISQQTLKYLTKKNKWVKDYASIDIKGYEWHIWTQRLHYMNGLIIRNNKKKAPVEDKKFNS